MVKILYIYFFNKRKLLSPNVPPSFWRVWISNCHEMQVGITSRATLSHVKGVRGIKATCISWYVVTDSNSLPCESVTIWKYKLLSPTVPLLYWRVWICNYQEMQIVFTCYATLQHVRVVQLVKATYISKQLRIQTLPYKSVTIWKCKLLSSAMPIL